MANSQGTASILLKAHTMGSLDLKRTEQAYNMLDMKVVGDAERGVSVTNKITVGNEVANNSWII